MEVAGNHILKALVDHGKEMRWEDIERYRVGLHFKMSIHWLLCVRQTIGSKRCRNVQ